MKKIITTSIAILISTLALLFLVNNFVRVSNGYLSYGYIEDILFEKPVKGKIDEIYFSENYLLWKDVNDRALYVADLLLKHGKNIVEDEMLEHRRIQLINILETALEKIAKLPDSYLKNSNQELLLNYRLHFQTALSL